MKKYSVTRRNFMRIGAGFVAAGAAVKSTVPGPDTVTRCWDAPGQ